MTRAVICIDPGMPVEAVAALLAARLIKRVPVVVDGRPVGGLTFSFGRPRTFDSDDREFLSAVARQSAQALERARHRYWPAVHTPLRGHGQSWQCSNLRGNRECASRFEVARRLADQGQHAPGPRTRRRD